MKSRVPFYLTFALAALLLASAEPTHKLTINKQAAEGLSDKIAALIDSQSFQVNGPDGVICEIWLAKTLDVAAGFQPSFSVNYPFESGQLIGALKVSDGAEFTDFRGQEISGGMYTLRYGQQPEDGNHVGTSELRDFLLALPAKADKDPKTVSLEQLNAESAKTAGSTHPAIFSLLPTEKAESATLTHDEDQDFWILTLIANAKAKGKAMKLPVRFVAIGQSEE